MSKIIYEAIPALECTDVHGDSRILTVNLPKDTLGSVSIGEVRCTLVDGTCKLNTSALADGEYTLYLHTEGRSIKLDTLELLGRRLKVVITKEKYYTLVRKYRDLNGEIQKLGERLDLAEGKIFDSVIF